MAKILSFIMAIFTALYMFVSCGKIPGTGDNETTTVPAETVTEPLGEHVSETESEETSAQTQQQAGQDEKESDTEVPPVSKTLKLKISGREVPVTWESNESVAALSQLSSEGLSVNMSMYGGFEQVGSLGSFLPRNDRQTTTHGFGYD